MIVTYLILGIILSIASIMDIQYFRIPNRCCMLLGFTGIVYSIITNRCMVECVIGCLSISMPLVFLYVFKQKRMIGGGDIKLLAASGVLLGWKKNLLAFLISGICVLVHKLWRAKYFYKREKIALCPYLSIGILVSFIAGDFLVAFYCRWPGITFR